MFSNRASILIGLLWCLALLSVVVIGFLHTARMDLQVGKNYGDRIQAHYLALAGIEKAKALLYLDAKDRSHNGKSHDGEYYNSPDQFRGITLGRGQFAVFRRGREDEGSGVIYGISDEESRLNVNTASADVLGRIDGMTPDVLAAIADWRDSDNVPSPGGAEAEYYASLQPPYQPRNGPFLTVRELLMVRGVTPDLLFGHDTHQNGLLDADDEKGANAFLKEQADNADLGWARELTVDSSVHNANAAGDSRVNVQSADENTLRNVRGITPEIARAIVAYRGQNQFQSIADLLDVTQPQNQNQNQNQGGGTGGQTTYTAAGQPQAQTQTTGTNQTANAAGQGGGGRKMISPDLLMDIGDEITVASASDLGGVININTASLEVLASLPGVDRPLAQAIINYRSSSGYFPNPAWLLKVPGISPDLFKQLAPLVTARSETFRILCEGRINSSGVHQRIQAIVHVGLDDIKILSWREDDL
jgi:competence ComEA-like helix-hairpin-helix protein